MPVTPDIVGLNDGNGTVLVNVHTADQCKGQFCCVHNPSQHHMLQWKPVWDGVFKHMWRSCPHSLIHPDPDDLAHTRYRWGSEVAASQSIHDCDGCCQPTADEQKQITS